MTTAEIIDETTSLPVEDRALIVDALLRSLNVPVAENDRAWAVVARNRLDELRSGADKGVSGKDVFEKIFKRFNP